MAGPNCSVPAGNRYALTSNDWHIAQVPVYPQSDGTRTKWAKTYLITHNPQPNARDTIAEYRRALRTQ